MQEYIIWGIVSYFIGNFSTSYLISKMLGKIDIREHGSGNAGATNVFRVLGAKAAALTFLGDALKGIIVAAVAKYFGSVELAIICGFAVIVGHNFPLLLKFKGGKGITTSIGVFLIIDPIVAIMPIIIGIIVIKKSKYVSLGSIVGMASLPFILLILGRTIEMVIFGLLISLLAIFQHRTNIRRLINDEESKIGSKKIIKK